MRELIKYQIYVCISHIMRESCTLSFKVFSYYLNIQHKDLYGRFLRHVGFRTFARQVSNCQGSDAVFCVQQINMKQSVAYSQPTITF